MMSRCRVVVGGALFLMMCGWGVWSVSVLAQSAPATPRLEFDAASVKPNPSSSAPQGFDVRTLAAGELRITATTLRELIRLAYGADFIRTQDQLVGGPSWLNVDRFDVIAKVDRSVLAGPGPGGNAAERMFTMLRALLQDRFKVKTHVEMKETSIYALKVARTDGALGPAIHPSTSDCVRPDPNGPPPADPSRLCGLRGGIGNFTAQGVTMPQLARSLAAFPVIGRVVEDHTDRPGAYDFTLTFVPAFLQAPDSGGPIANPAADAGPNIFTAVREQLGLKLDGAKSQVQVLVVDAAERPTPD